MREYLLHYSVIFSWALSLFFLGKSALAWWRGEPSRRGALLALAAIAVPAAITAFLLPPRGGYDNNHDYLSLGTTFFTTRPLVFPLFKEYSPLFTDGLADLLSGFSLRAVLWKNRLLPVLSLFVFFTGLRRLGAGLAASAGAAALLFLNFLSPLNASSFSTTSANMFIWLLSLLALFDAHASPRLGAGNLLWILATTVLVISARFEFLPVNLLIFAAVLISKPAGERKALAKPASLLLLIAGAGLLALWGARALSANPERMLRDLSSPVQHLLSQLGTRNLAIPFGAGLPAAENPGPQTAEAVGGAAAALCLLFLLFSVAGALLGGFADREKAKRYGAFLAVLLLWLGYFSAIFSSADHYPLHFMRHQLYFFLPCACLFALGLEGFESAAKRLPAAWTGAFGALLCLCLAAYAALNARAAFGLNAELRTNDRELAFLMEAQSGWEPGCLAIYTPAGRDDARAALLAKYFPVMDACAGGPGQCLLKYVSPEPVIFDRPAPPLAQKPLLAGTEGEAWRSASFKHSFYTILQSPGGAGAPYRLEKAGPLPLTLGFFRPDHAGRDKAFLASAAGACAFSAGNHAEAGRRFAEAAREDPSCLNCGYFLALSEAALGRRREAAAGLERTEKAAGGLPPAQRSLILDLSGGKVREAEAAALELESRDPYFFFGKKLSAGIRLAGPRE